MSKHSQNKKTNTFLPLYIYKKKFNPLKLSILINLCKETLKEKIKQITPKINKHPLKSNKKKLG